MSIFHLVALLLTLGIGTNYALFLARASQSGAERRGTLRTLAVVAGTTLCAFGALTLSSTPVLHAIGMTVCLGSRLQSAVEPAAALATAVAIDIAIDINLSDRRMTPLPLAAVTLTNACGVGLDEIRARAARRHQRAAAQRFRAGAWTRHLDRPRRRSGVGSACAGLCWRTIVATTAWRGFASNRTALSRRWTRRARATASDRIGVFIGTTTSGILSTELAYRRDR